VVSTGSFVFECMHRRASQNMLQSKRLSTFDMTNIIDDITNIIE